MMLRDGVWTATRFVNSEPGGGAALEAAFLHLQTWKGGYRTAAYGESAAMPALRGRRPIFRLSRAGIAVAQVE